MEQLPVITKGSPTAFKLCVYRVLDYNRIVRCADDLMAWSIPMLFHLKLRSETVEDAGVRIEFDYVFAHGTMIAQVIRFFMAMADKSEIRLVALTVGDVDLLVSHTDKLIEGNKGIVAFLVPRR